MTSPLNPTSPGTGGHAKVPLSTIHNRPTSQGSTSTSSQPASLNPDRDNDSISSVRKRDRFRNFFRPSKSKDKPKDSSVIGTQFTTGTGKARPDVFSENASRPAASIEVPKIGSRFSSTPQLVLCSNLLPKSQYVQDQGAQDHAKDAPHDTLTNQAHLDWINAIEKDIVERDRIRLLGTRMVEEFSKHAVKGLDVITEVALLGPVLDDDHYRKLLNCFISEFKNAHILDIHLLKGLIQLVQSAPKGYLVADDLINILRILRLRLQNTHQQAPEHPYHLTLAVSRLLDVMAEHKVKDVRRVEDHEPLSEILSGLRSSSDPYLMYQASYAHQALQYVPDDETPLQAVFRHSARVAESVIKISGVIKLDLTSALDGLKGFQAALSSTYDAAKAGYEGVQSLKESGHGLLDSLKDGLSTGQKRLWYPALRVADGFVRQGQLVDLNRLIIDAPCRRDPLFQWGICQLLGEIAADEDWEITTRQQAMDLLVDLYRNDTEWAQDESVKSWMLAVIVQLGDASHPAMKNHVNHLLQDMQKNASSTTEYTYPLMAHLPMPVSSPLLTRIQGIPFVEDDLHQLKRLRLEECIQAVYIPPIAKPNQQASDNDVFPLMEKVVEFLDSERQVMLILGDSGAGKSTFNRHLECQLWREYKSGGRIPLFINMPALSKPESELISEQLRMHKFSEVQIQELERQRQLIVICDGYDESQLTINIHTTNQLNRPGRWNVKLVVSCRSQYLGHDYHNRFVPEGNDHYSAPALHLFQEAVITPFSRSQIEDYVKQYVPLEPRPWVTEDYMDKLITIPNLMDLVTNPFLLTLSLGALPTVVKNKTDLKNLRITRVALYDSFVHHWIGANKRRLEKQNLEKHSRTTLNELIEDGFERIGIEYQKGLAAAIFQEQDGKPFVDYTHRRDKQSWKAKFFGPEPEPTLLRSCSLLIRIGNQHRFIHRSMLEYFQSRFIHEPDNEDDHDYRATTSPDAAASVQQPIADHPLSKRSFVGEPSIIQFLCEHVQEDVAYKKHLLAIIEHSKTNPDASQAASNAITILVRAGVMFNGADLQGIQIPGADISGGQFDTAQLQGADLRNTNLRNIWLRQANLSKAQMAGVHFGEWPFLEEDDRVSSCAYSPDGKTLAVGLRNGTISLYKTATWEKTSTLSGHTKEVTSIVFSPSGQQIASGSYDITVRLWDAQTSAPGAILSGHSDWVTGVVFSPSGQQIASGSEDKTVRLWDAQTGAPGAILSGHFDWVTSVVFSPSGQQIASGSGDETVRLWDAQTGAPGAILSGHSDPVTSVVFSPSGQQIASGSEDNTVRLWDAQTGAPGAILSGHSDPAMSVAFSPSGQRIVSGSWDKTVRLWDAKTGAPGAILSGHSRAVTSVVFSPSGQQIASGSEDKTVRLWDAQTGAPGAILSGHSDPVTSVVFSPSGQYIASGSYDITTRFWDAQTGAPGAILSGHSGTVTSVMFTPSGQQTASDSYDITVRLWGAQTSAPGAILSGHTGAVTSVVFSPSGQQTASGSWDKTVRLWDAQTGAPGAILSGHSGAVTSVVFSPSGQQIASGSWDKTVRLWDAQTGAPGAILSGHYGAVMSVMFSPSGQQIASSSDDKTVRLWDAQTGAPGAILSGHSGRVTSVVFSPSGQQIASGSWDRTVRLWDAQTGAPGAILSGHSHDVTSVVFSPSGQRIASGSEDETLRLWDINSGLCLAVVNGLHGGVSTAAWNEYGNGSYIATGCGDKSVRLWEVEDGHHLVHLRWSSSQGRLAVSDASIVGAQGLSKTNMKLLVQRGAVSQPMSF